MKLKELIFENQKVETIKKECSEVLSLIDKTGVILYHGSDKITEEITKLRPPKNRKPKHSSVYIQNFIDEYLQEHGFTALRQNSFFLTSDAHQTGLYGDPFVVLPINNSDVLWFKNSFDLTVDLNFHMEEYNYEDFAETARIEDIQKEKETLTKILDYFEPNSSLEEYFRRSDHGELQVSSPCYFISLEYFENLKTELLGTK